MNRTCTYFSSSGQTPDSINWDSTINKLSFVISNGNREHVHKVRENWLGVLHAHSFNICRTMGDIWRAIEKDTGTAVALKETQIIGGQIPWQKKDEDLLLTLHNPGIVKWIASYHNESVLWVGNLYLSKLQCIQELCDCSLFEVIDFRRKKLYIPDAFLFEEPEIKYVLKPGFEGV